MGLFLSFSSISLLLHILIILVVKAAKLFIAMYGAIKQNLIKKASKQKLLKIQKIVFANS